MTPVWHSWENPDGSAEEDYAKPSGCATERAELERLGWTGDERQITITRAQRDDLDAWLMAELADADLEQVLESLVVAYDEAKP